MKIMIALFIGCVATMAVAVYFFLQNKEEATPHRYSKWSIAWPEIQGCIAHSDGKASRRCSLQIACDDGKSTCILDDGTVCIQACDPCVRQIDGEWVKVNGWKNENGEPVTVTPKVVKDLKRLDKIDAEAKRKVGQGSLILNGPIKGDANEGAP